MMRLWKLAALLACLFASPALAQGVPNPIDQSQVGAGSQWNSSTAAFDTTDCCIRNVTLSSDVAMANPDCGTKYFGSAVTTYKVTTPSSAPTHCVFEVSPGLAITRITFTGVALRWDGVGAHDITELPLKSLKENSYCQFERIAATWKVNFCSGSILVDTMPTALPKTVNGQVQLTHSGSQVNLNRYSAPGWNVVGGYPQRLLSQGLSSLDSGNTSSATNYYYEGHQGAAVVTGAVIVGPNLRLTLSASPAIGGNAGDLCDIIAYSIGGALEGNGVHPCTVVDATHLDVTDVSSIASAYTSGGIIREKFLYPSTTAPVISAVDGTYVDPGAVGGNYVGFCVVGAAHVPSSCTSWYHGAEAITGAVKYDGAGNASQAACTDLSNATNACSGNANGLSSGTVDSARGGAGTINGALKGNGSGAVSQAAASDLSNGTTGSGAVVLGTAPTIGGTLTTTGHHVSAGTALASGDFALGTGAGGSPTFTSVVGDDNRFRLSFTTGTSPVASAIIFTLTFKAAWGATPFCFVAGENSASGQKISSVSLAPGTTTLVFNSGTVGLVAATAYIFTFQCIG